MRRFAVVVVASASLLVVGTPAVSGTIDEPVGAGATHSGGEPVVGAQVTTKFFRYLPGDDALPTATLRIVEGGSLTYTNLEIFAPHDVTHEGCRPPAEPEDCLFQSPTLGFRLSAEVDGVPDLPPGDYSFYCSVPGHQMSGTLVVEEAP